MNNLRLSIALCTYNGSRFLPEQLESIATQTRSPDELVICDDGSTDSTLAIVNEFGRRVPFPVRVHTHEKPAGSTRNFERAIELCNGDIIVFSDQDDVWLPDRLRATEAAFQSSPNAGAFFSDAEIVDASLHPLGYRLWNVVRFGRREQALFRHAQAVSVLLRRNVVTGATLSIRSGLRKLILPIPDGWVHDAWIALLVAVTGELVFSPRPLVKYRQHAANQLGALERNIGDQIERARGPHSETYAAAAANYAAARDRLLTAKGVVVPPDIICRLNNKIAHMQTRASLPRSRFRRLPTVLSELAAGRYHGYSNSWKSFTRDLWF